MKLKVLFEASLISRANGVPIEVYPEGGVPPPPGVGTITTGKYNAIKGASGYFIFTRTNAGISDTGLILGAGIMTKTLHDNCGNNIILSTTYEVQSGSPDIQFSLVKLTGLITGATINGHLASGKIKYDVIDGGKQLLATINLKVAHSQ